MTTISDDVRDRVNAKYNNRCAYCHVAQKYLMQKLEIDHILPKSKGGTDDEDNLCPACRMCNGYKHNKTEAVDPLTDETVNLYNPATQNWHDHFQWADDNVYLEGITTVGRTTVSALKMNNATFIRTRRIWVSVGWHPPKD